MSEWTSLIAVYWALWALDGVRLGARHSFAIIGSSGPRRGSVDYDRWLRPSFLPTSWRLTTTDPPLSLSPAGVANLPRGSAGRPAESPAGVQAWRWEEIRHVGVAKGWVYINDQPFCPDTHHVTPRELLALAESPSAQRGQRIDSLIRGWLRPGHLRRRARALEARTALAVACNVAALLMGIAISLYALADVASRLNDEQAAAVANVLPIALAAVLLLHLTGVVLAWRARRRLRAAGVDRRGTALAGALLLPPQALKLRALLAEGYFPPHHPLAAIMAFAGPEDIAMHGFQVLADIRWPAAHDAAPALAIDIANWFGHALEPHVNRVLRQSALQPASLLRPPAPDSPASCRYCPRCRDQFTAGLARCPHGVELLPLISAGDEHHE